MLRVDAVLVLERDVYPLIPKEHLQLPVKLSQNPNIPQFLSPQGCQISIVGNDRNECLLVYYKGFSKDQLVPFISEFNLKTTQLKPLWAPHGLHNLLPIATRCCINEDRTLLGFDGTGKGREQSQAPPSPAKSPEEEGPEIDLYESYIAELIDDEGACYSLMNKRTQQPQHLHFLQGQGKGSSSFVYIYFNQSSKKYMAELFSIYTQKHTSGAVKVSAKPQFKFRICNRLYWYEWDTKREYLYLLERRKTEQQIITNSKKLACYLTCYMFQDRKPVLNARYAIDIQAQVGATALVEDDLKIVRFTSDDPQQQNPPAICLCQQHAYVAGSRSIAITVFIFHHDLQLDFSIPFPDSVPAEVIAKTKVFFEVTGSRMMIYIPGHYLQLLECGLERPPHLGLVLTGPEFATAIRGYEGNQLPCLESLDLKKQLAQSSRGFVMMDRRQGVIFEYTFNHERILKMLDAKDPELAQQALWIACNTGDHELIGQVVLQMCMKNPLLITAEFLKEYLIGAPHVELLKELKKKPKSGEKQSASSGSSAASAVEPAVLMRLSNILPSSASEPLFSDGVRYVRNQEFRTTSIGLKVPPTPRIGSDSKKKTAISMSSLDWNLPMDDIVPTPSVFRRLVTNMNKWFGLPDTNQAAPVDEEQWFDSVKPQVVGALTKHIFDLVSKDLKVTKSECYQWATDYRALQGRFGHQLYQLILQGSQEHDESTLFHLLSHLYSSLEELMYPMPKTFHDKFAALGYRCLPRQVFLQYVERQIFTLSPEFVLQALSTPQPYEDDSFFRYQLLSAIPEPEALEIMRKLQMDEDYIVEHALSYEQDKNYNVDMENVEDAEFLPLGVYLEALQSKHLFSDEDLSFISAVERGAFLKTLKLNNIPL